MHFGRPEFLNALVALPLAWLLIRRGRRKRRETIRRFGNPTPVAHLARGADAARRKPKERLFPAGPLGGRSGSSRAQRGHRDSKPGRSHGPGGRRCS